LYSGDLFNKSIWHHAFVRAGLDQRRRADGMHALRHFYASAFLAQGVSIKELAEYLGHSDPGFTLRTYTHWCRPASNEPVLRSTASFTDGQRWTAWTRPDLERLTDLRSRDR
jgi:integrase